MSKIIENEEMKEQDDLFNDDEEDPTGLLKIISHKTNDECQNLNIKWKNYIHESANKSSVIGSI